MALLHHVLVLSLAWMSVQTAGEKYFFQNSDGDRTVVVVTLKEDGRAKNCEILTNKYLIENALKSSDASNIRTVSNDDMEEILQECKEFIARRGNEDTNIIMMNENEIDPNMDAPKTTTPGYDGWPVIFPGTKWCGAGDIAKNYDDLGLHQDTDRCCRAHDLCNDTLAPGEKKNNLTNTSPFTKLSCECDNDFYSCLDRVNSVTSNTIGNMYFNLLKRECYAFDHPMKCKRYVWPFKKICLKYEKDTSKKKAYHWIPAKKYKKIPIPGPLTFTLPF